MFAKVMYITSILDNFNPSKMLDFYCICTSFERAPIFPDPEKALTISGYILRKTAIRISIKKEI